MAQVSRNVSVSLPRFENLGAEAMRGCLAKPGSATKQQPAQSRIVCGRCGSLGVIVPARAAAARGSASEKSQSGHKGEEIDARRANGVRLKGVARNHAQPASVRMGGGGIGLHGRSAQPPVMAEQQSDTASWS